MLVLSKFRKILYFYSFKQRSNKLSTNVSTKKNFIYIANEMSPYLELTDFAETVNKKLAIKAN